MKSFGKKNLLLISFYKFLFVGNQGLKGEPGRPNCLIGCQDSLNRLVRLENDFQGKICQENSVSSINENYVIRAAYLV